jgi:hypothetical protein
MTSSASPDASLRNLVDAGLLKTEPTSGSELKGLLESSADLLRDARNPQNSEVTRFSAAYQAAHSLSLAALRSRDLRPSQGPGHRAIVFQALAHTVGAAPELWVPLGKAHKKRNALEYDGRVIFSGGDVKELLELVGTLDRLVRKALAGKA